MVEARTAWQEILRQRTNALPVQWFSGTPNVGDLASPLLCEFVLDRRVVSTTGDEPHVLGLGSILSSSNERSLVWGTGMMHPQFGVGGVVARNVLALRGKLTASELRRAGVFVPEVPLGDPGLLADCLPGFLPSTQIEFDLGIVPHYVDRAHPMVAAALIDPRILVLDVAWRPQEFLRQMSRCKAVVSSSLHGLVFASALGIPHTWLEMSKNVVGDGFKFMDYFSVCDNPQGEALRIDVSDAWTKDPIDLAKTAEPRPYAGSRNELICALKDAVSDGCVNESTAARSKARRAVSSKVVPAVIISYNRAHELQRCVNSMKSLDPRIEVVIHDNGSEDIDTVLLLNRLEKQGLLVLRKPKIDSADQLNEVDESVQFALRRFGNPAYYVVTDCDIDVSVMRSDALDLFAELLQRDASLNVVGPMLRIRDIPSWYPLRSQAIRRHYEQFWKNKPELVDIDGLSVYVQRAHIDTTFGVHRSEDSFRRLKSGLRVYAPWEAIHLDWYGSQSEISNSAYFSTSSARVANWSRVERAGDHVDTSERLMGIWDIELSRHGDPVGIVRQDLRVE